jgi:hypothetical protein
MWKFFRKLFGVVEKQVLEYTDESTFDFVQDYVDWMAESRVRRLFQPAGVAARCGLSEEQAEVELRKLVVAGTLKEQRHIYCPEGHCTWAGPPSDVPPYIECTQCVPEFWLDGTPTFTYPDDYRFESTFYLATE